MTVRTIRHADKVEEQNENEMLEGVDDDIRPRHKKNHKNNHSQIIYTDTKIIKYTINYIFMRIQNNLALSEIYRTYKQ